MKTKRHVEPLEKRLLAFSELSHEDKCHLMTDHLYAFRQVIMKTIMRNQTLVRGKMCISNSTPDVGKLCALFKKIVDVEICDNFYNKSYTFGDIFSQLILPYGNKLYATAAQECSALHYLSSYIIKNEPELANALIEFGWGFSWELTTEELVTCGRTPHSNGYVKAFTKIRGTRLG